MVNTLFIQLLPVLTKLRLLSGELYDADAETLPDGETLLPSAIGLSSSSL